MAEPWSLPRRMLFTVKVTQAALREGLAVLREELLRNLVLGLAGRCQSREYCSYLWHRLGPRRLPRTALAGIPVYLGSPRSEAQSRACLEEFMERCRERPEAEAALLLLGRGRRAGRVEGAVFRRPEFYPLDRCQVLPADPLLSLPLPIQPEEVRRYSRVIGGLGTDVWGELAWPRLRDARWCLVGAGRGGTALAMLLAQQGALYLTIIDPDQIQEHNLDGMPAPSTAVGSSKAQMLAFLLQRFRPEL